MNWKRIARRLRSRYRLELAIERGRTEATREALKAMINELANNIGCTDEVDELLLEETEPSERGSN